MGDAFGSIVAANPELLDIYLEGTKIEKLVAEVVCGEIDIQGVKVVVPPNRFDVFIERLTALEGGHLYSFLAFRADKSFLSRYLNRHPELYSELSKGTAYLSSRTSAYLLARLHEFELLPELWRIKFVEMVTRISIDMPDAEFLSSVNIRSLFSEREIADLLKRIELELLPTLSDIVEELEANYDGDEDPDEYFSQFADTLTVFKEEYPESSEARSQITKALNKIDSAIEYIRDETPEEEREREPDYDSSYWGGHGQFGGERSIFDDVDQ
jgi:hypothetical protein